MGVGLDLFRDTDVSGAIFSDDRVYRYALWRVWDRNNPARVAFIGLNPSTADEHTDDPTIRRCIGFAKQWGAGGLLMLNLFAFRATDPAVMKRAVDPVGGSNDNVIRILTIGVRVVAAWGTDGAFMGRDAAVVEMLTREGVTVECLGCTKGGLPRHPLYLRADTALMPYEVPA